MIGAGTRVTTEHEAGRQVVDMARAPVNWAKDRMQPLSTWAAGGPVDSAYTQGVKTAAQSLAPAIEAEIAHANAIQALPDSQLAAAIDAIRAAASTVAGGAERIATEQKPSFASDGFVSTATLASLTLMVPVVSVGARLLDLLLWSDARLLQANWLAWWIAMVVSMLLVVNTWPSLAPDRSNRAHTALATGFFLLNALVICGAALGLAEAVDQSVEENAAGNQATTPTR